MSHMTGNLPVITQPVQTLPPHYQRHATLDLSQNKTALIGLNIAAVVLFFGFGWLVLQIVPLLRPHEAGQTVSFGGTDMLVFGVALIVLMIFQIVLHELIHGLFFWIFTRDRPVFGFKGMYAYAAAPNWYVPHTQHLIVGLAPLVLITLAGFVLIAVAPPAAVPLLVLLIVINAAGAVGDIAVVVWEATQPHGTLVRDTGDAITLYRPDATAQ